MRAAILAIFVISPSLHAQDADLAAKLRTLDAGTIVLGPVREPPLASMLRREVQSDLKAAVVRETQAWEKVTTRDAWEAFRAERLKRFEASLGTFPDPPKPLKIRVTGSHQGDGYVVDNVVFESRAGIFVTANLYRPAKPAASMPGMIVVHSHIQPKNIGYRQDMGMTWARAGCVVLIPDLIGHGERRQHPFRDLKDYPKPFAPGRQDYNFRYDSSLQFYLMGDSLMGWIVWDLRRCVDFLLAQPGVDARRIVMFSEPAGGGDPAAVTAALEPRIAGVLVNNFGGPQPETPYPLPKDAEISFDFAGNGSWESTRNLHRSARDGFQPWFILASLAPRQLLYYHEFYWDRDGDPVWTRLQKAYDFYGAKDRLLGLAGHGFVVGKEPLNTHWIAYSREMAYPHLQRMFAIPDPKKEYSQRLPESKLECLTPDLVKEWKIGPAHLEAAKEADQRLANARAMIAKTPPPQRREKLRTQFAEVLGDVKPRTPTVVRTVNETLGDVAVEKIHLRMEPGVVVPMILLKPNVKQPPIVVGLAQGGKQGFLTHRSAEIAQLLKLGVAVALPDLRGTGESSPGDARDRGAPITAISASALMVGEPLVGRRLRDLRGLLAYLRTRSDLSPRFGLWGDSFAPVNGPTRELHVPYGIDNRPAPSEPLGGLLALLGALHEEDVQVLGIQGGLSDFRSVLDSPFVTIPHDVVLPGQLRIADLPDLVATLSPHPIWLSGLVDHQNRSATPKHLELIYRIARTAYQNRPSLRIGASDGETMARWLAKHLVPVGK